MPLPFPPDVTSVLAVLIGASMVVMTSGVDGTASVVLEMVYESVPVEAAKLASPEYTALSEFVPDGSPEVRHPAYPEFSVTVAQPVMVVEPFLKSTVPVAPNVTIELKLTSVPMF